MALFWGLAGIITVLALWMLRRLRLDDPVQRHWLRFCAKLGRAGLARRPSEGPRDFAERVANRYPHKADLARGIGALYIDLRYGAQRERTAVAQLGKLVRQFSP
jgi:hypothetical protein